MYLLPMIAANLIMTVSPCIFILVQTFILLIIKHLTRIINLYSLLHIYYSFLIKLLMFRMLELHVPFSIHSSAIPQWRVSCWFMSVASCIWGSVVHHHPLLQWLNILTVFVFFFKFRLISTSWNDWYLPSVSYEEDPFKEKKNVLG